MKTSDQKLLVRWLLYLGVFFLASGFLRLAFPFLGQEFGVVAALLPLGAGGASILLALAIRGKE